MGKDKLLRSKEEFLNFIAIGILLTKITHSCLPKNKPPTNKKTLQRKQLTVNL